MPSTTKRPDQDPDQGITTAQFEPVISIRNGVPPDAAPPQYASDPPGGIPKTPDPDTRPHPTPTEGHPRPTPATDLPENEPPPVPPKREAAPASTVHVTRTTHTQVSRAAPQRK